MDNTDITKRHGDNRPAGSGCVGHLCTCKRLAWNEYACDTCGCICLFLLSCSSDVHSWRLLIGTMSSKGNIDPVMRSRWWLSVHDTSDVWPAVCMLMALIQVTHAYGGKDTCSRGQGILWLWKWPGQNCCPPTPSPLNCFISLAVFGINVSPDQFPVVSYLVLLSKSRSSPPLCLIFFFEAFLSFSTPVFHSFPSQHPHSLHQHWNSPWNATC
jgi:hypothetical protein